LLIFAQQDRFLGGKRDDIFGQTVL
jgi:hypothetical protein